MLGQSTKPRCSDKLIELWRSTRKRPARTRSRPTICTCRAAPGAALAAADAGLTVNPNDLSLFAPRASAENALGRFEEAKADAK